MSNNIPSVLKKIIATKEQEVLTRKAVVSLEELIQQSQRLLQESSNTSSNSAHNSDHDKPLHRGFADALRTARTNNEVGIIAEIKKASPSKGIISHNFDPISIAQGYEQAGARCLSVLTDVDYFQGSDEYLQQARGACNLPILRKDFMIDEYQIYESFVLGADCILLIMACLDDPTVLHLQQCAIALGMDVLIEVHTQHELERALQLPQSPHNIYGINNRDLNTFEVDLQHSIRLKDQLIAALDNTALVVSESGIHSADDVNLMRNNDIHTFLIGEQFMKTDNPALALESLLLSL